MIAVYLHQIIFAGLADISIAEPWIIKCVEQWPDGSKRLRRRATDPQIGDRLASILRKKDKKCLEVVRECIELYVSLRVWSLAQGYMKSPAKVDEPKGFEAILTANQTKWKEAADNVAEAFRKLAGSVSSLTGIQATTLEERGVEGDEEKIMRLRAKFGELKFDNVQYERIIRDSITGFPA